MEENNNELPERLKSELAQNIKVEEYFTTVRHSVNPGDLYAVMGALKKYYAVTKRKIIILQQINLPASYYQSATHPTIHDGVMVTMNQKMFDMVLPLVKSQEYVHDMEVYDGQQINIDLNVIRGKTFVNMPHGPIQGWVPLAHPDISFDLSKPWIMLDGNCPLKIKEQVKGKIILNFTERYRAPLIDYFFLKNYAPDLIFAGTEKEHWLFCNQWQLNIPRLEIDDFLELAYALKESRFSLSNQSQLWNLAQAMGTPRILEMCSYADNCFPNIGENSEGYLYQAGCEYYFRSFYNTINKNPQG